MRWIKVGTFLGTCTSWLFDQWTQHMVLVVPFYDKFRHFCCRSWVQFHATLSFSHMTPSLKEITIVFQNCIKISYVVSYGISCHYGNFSDDTFYEQVNKYCHGWWTSSSIGQNPTFSFCQQLVMKYCHGWLKFGWKITSLQHYESIIPQKKITRNDKWRWVNI